MAELQGPGDFRFTVRNIKIEEVINTIDNWDMETRPLSKILSRECHFYTSLYTFFIQITFVHI